MRNKSLNSVLYLAIITIVAVLFCSPILRNFSYWGQMDWDQFSFWNAVPRLTLLKYHQFPLWNPYTNGGNVLLAHPHSSFLSPLYLFVLFLGPVSGLKVQLILHVIIGMGGMFLLLRYLKNSKTAAYLSSFVFMLSSLYPLHLTEGHTEWLAMAFVPWLFLGFLKGLTSSVYILGGIMALSLMLLGGSVDVFNIMVVFMLVYSILKSVQVKSFAPVKILFLIFAGTFMLCAIKLLPMLEFLHQYPRLTEDNSGTSFLVLLKVLLGNKQVIYDSLSIDTTPILGLPHGWHEYGAYIGIVPLLLFLAGVIIYFKQRWPLILSGFAALFVSMGSKAPLNLWAVLHQFPVYNSLNCPSRFILGFVFSAALLAGLALTYFQGVIKKSNYKKLYVIFLCVVVFVLIDLCRVNTPIFKNAFRIKPLEVEENVRFQQRYDYVNMFHVTISRSSKYPALLSNSGILDALNMKGIYDPYEVVNIKRGAVKTVLKSEYKGEIYLASGQGKVFVEYFSPNKIKIKVDVYKNERIVVNQNFSKGWKVSKNGVVSRAVSSNGLIASEVTPGKYNVTFFYRPKSFLVGSFISIGFILSILIYLKLVFKKVKK